MYRSVAGEIYPPLGGYIGGRLIWKFTAVTREKLNPLRSSGAIWYSCNSTLVNVMAWCQTAPSHYLNQYWQTITEILWHSSEVNFLPMFNRWIHDTHLNITHFKFHSHLPRANESIMLKRKCQSFWRNFHRWLHQFSQWWKFHQNEDISVSVNRETVILPLSTPPAWGIRSVYRTLS